MENNQARVEAISIEREVYLTDEKKKKFLRPPAWMLISSDAIFWLNIPDSCQWQRNSLCDKTDMLFYYLQHLLKGWFAVVKNKFYSQVLYAIELTYLMEQNNIWRIFFALTDCLAL